MKEIGLHTKNAHARLQAAIQTAEGRSTARTVTADQVEKALSDLLEKHLPPVPRKALFGIHVELDLCAQDFPRAYKYVPVSTHVYARYDKYHWYIVDVDRDTCHAAGHAYTVRHTDASRAAIWDFYSSF